jgi:hypothetical protein
MKLINNTQNLGNFLCIGWLLFACSGRVVGATITAAGCSQAQVQSAIDSAKDGDTVQVPAGSATWTSEVTVIGKSIKLLGAGIGFSNITRNSAVGSVALDVELSSTQTFTLSGFTFSTIPSAQSGIIWVQSTNHTPTSQFRITNCRINVAPSSPTVGYRGIGIAGTYGVIDHCYFRNASSGGQGVSMFGDNTWTETNCPTYSTPQSLGDTNAVVIEDCTFDFDSVADGAIDAYIGTKFVFRHNTVTNTIIGWHGADSGPRSCRSYEIYNNTFGTTGAIASYTAIRSRGGTGVVWDNTITGNYSNFFILSHYRANPSYSSAVGALGSKVDGNFDATHYPLLDQTGRGSFQAGTPWPSLSSYTVAQYEVLDPMYQWGNNFKGSTSPTCNVALPDQSSTYIKPNRDYYDNKPKPGYVPLKYPHPLVSASASTSSQASGPNPPQGLRMQ